jgi:hypothetical protein
MVSWKFATAEADGAGWWTVKIGLNPDGTREAQKVRFFPHSRLSPGAARFAAHCAAFDLAAKEGLERLETPGEKD